jgi:hypothetical protein
LPTHPFYLLLIIEEALSLASMLPDGGIEEALSLASMLPDGGIEEALSLASMLAFC